MEGVPPRLFAKRRFRSFEPRVKATLEKHWEGRDVHQETRPKVDAVAMAGHCSGPDPHLPNAS